MNGVDLHAVNQCLRRLNFRTFLRVLYRIAAVARPDGEVKKQKFEVQRITDYFTETSIVEPDRHR